MAVVNYPAFKQCYPTSRNEVTKVLSEMSENGVIRGRVMFSTPTYELYITHDSLSLADNNAFDTWWKGHLNSEVLITWAADKKQYRGIIKQVRSINVNPGLPDPTFTVSVNLLVKEV